MDYLVIVLIITLANFVFIFLNLNVYWQDRKKEEQSMYNLLIAVLNTVMTIALLHTGYCIIYNIQVI